MRTAEPTFEKPLPMNLEAERMVLGCALLDPGVFEQAMTLDAGDFFSPANRSAFQKMAMIHSRGEVINPLTLQEELRLAGELERVGGPYYVSSLFDGVSRFSNIESYVKLVRDTSRERRLIHLGNAIINRAFDGEETIDDQLRQAEQDLALIGCDNSSSHWSDIAGVAFDVMQEAEKRSQSDRRVLDFSTGFSDLDYATDGLERGTVVVVGGAPGMGKAQPLWAKVRTPSGWKYMADITVGDAVSSPSLSESVVAGVFPQGEKDIFRITFSDGRFAYCCGDHLWRVHSKDWGRYGSSYKTITTNQIAEYLGKKSYASRLHVPLCRPQDGRPVTTFIHPYILGVLIGDGNITGSVRFSTKDDDIAERVATLLNPEYQLVREDSITLRIVKRDHRMEKNFTGGAANAYKEELKRLNLWGATSERKFIPAGYQNASTGQRLELLRGLLDTDGTVESAGTVRFCTVSPTLARDVQRLAWSLGAVCKIAPKKTHYYQGDGQRKNCKDAFILTIRHTDPATLFTLERKKARLPENYQYADCLYLGIESIEPWGREECQCISVTDPDGLYITDDYVVTHNTGFGLSMTSHMSEAKENIIDGRPPVIGWFSMEMPKKQQAQRLLASTAMVDMKRLRSGMLGNDEWRRVAEATQKLAGWRVHFDDRAALSPRKMREALRKLKNEEGRVDIVFVDYVQLGDGEKQRGETRENEVSRISRSLVEFAKDYNCTVVALSQLNRELFKRADKRPNLGDFRDSGQIAQDAYILIGLYRDEVYNPKTEQQNIAELILLKNRNGPLSTIELVFLKQVMRFEDTWNKQQ